MTKNELNDGYFEWMYQLVCSDRRFKKASYRRLLSRLHATEFIFSIAMDGNRADDGTNLRYRFGYEMKHAEPMVTTYLDDRPCSVLEMMVALSIRCEEHIMGDDEIGNRTGQWFWGMIENMGLTRMKDRQFDAWYVGAALDTLLNRRYQPNGEGGLFTVRNPRRDMRSVDIWYQMCWYLCDIA